MKKIKLILTLGMIACVQAVFNANAKNMEASYAREFNVKDGVIYADGKPFLLITDYNWIVLEQNDDFFRYWARMGGTCHIIMTRAIQPVEKQDFTKIDKEIELAAKYGLYSVVSPNISYFGGKWGYARIDPSAATKDPDGKDAPKSCGSFTHEGYRALCVKALRELAAHCKDKPYFLGYYLQDEFSYSGWCGYEAASVNVFRDRIMTQYGSLDKLNAAWGTKYVNKENIVPPTPKEQSGRRWADWQLFRSWAYTDLLRLCYQTIKEVDPKHLVINSMSFWPYQSCAASWWNDSPYMDILMRHGIGYEIGFNLFAIRDIAEWSGKAGAALCMPPGSSPSFVFYMYLLDSSRVGLSYVCPAGVISDGVCCGAADKSDGYRRREPQYTPAKAIIQLQHYLGDTYLTSKNSSPQVGYLIGAQKVTVAGGNAAGIAGMMEILTDLNIDFEIVSEHNFAPLKRFQAIIIGPEMQQASDEMVTAVNKYARDGGAVILIPGAFEKNEWNEPASINLFQALGRFGKPVSCKTVIADGGEIPVLNAKTVCPVEVKPDDNVLARLAAGQTNEAAAVVSGDGKTLFLGWDAGVPYRQTWSEDFANVGQDDDVQTALFENAFGPNARDSLKVETATGVRSQRRIAAWIKDFLATQQVTPCVIVKGQETPGLVHAKSFTSGFDIWMGIANRVIKQGQNHKGFEWDLEKYPEKGGAWPVDFHVPITNAEISVKLPENFPDKARCFLMPNMKVIGERITAVPEELPAEIVKTGREKSATFTLGRIDDWAAVVLSPGYRPLAGLELERREIVQGAKTVNVKMTLLNASDKPIKGALSLKDEDGLCKERPVPVAYELRPGETKNADMSLAVASDIKIGYYNLKAEAVGANGAVAESMGLEVRVLEPVAITMKPENGYLYVKPDAPVKMEVKVVLRDDKIKGVISVELEGFTNFAFEKNKEVWTLDGAKDHTFMFTVKTPQTNNISEAGNLSMRGNFTDGIKQEWSQSLRVTAGTTAYRETRQGKIDNSSSEISDIEFACLENEHLIARFIIASGVLHNLIVRRTRMELLSPDKYPFGLTWYNRKKNWTLEKMEAGQITLACGEIGMTASIQAGQECVDVSYDFAGTKLTNKDCFLLISRIGTEGNYKQDVIHVPLKNGVREMKWKSQNKEYKPDEITKPWLAVEDKASCHILGAFFDVPALEKISLAPGLNGLNYETFYLKDGVSGGKIYFRLFGAQGGTEKIKEWEKVWKGAGQ